MLPKRAVTALQAHKKRQAAERLAAGTAWQHNNLVFCHEDGRMYTSDDEAGRHRPLACPRGTAHRGLDHEQQRRSAPGDQRHRGPKSTHVTESVYRQVVVPAIRGGATVMDSVFGDPGEGDNQYGTSEAS